MGDPLLTVPINADVSQVSLSKPLYLCYEIHGRQDAYFNFISDDCVSVTAHYIKPNNIEFLNVIDSVSILAVDNSGRCHRIQVDVDQCATTFDGMGVMGQLSKRTVNYIQSPFTHRGISIRRYADRVRVKVPNCADVSLAMWVVCERVNVTDPYTEANLGVVEMIKFVVARGYNLREYSHGLLG